MTITEHALHSTSFDDSYPVPAVESREDPFSAAFDEQVAMPAVASDANPSLPQRQLRVRRFTAIAERRPYHHPRRERFVEEAAMSREMFRL
jgi:hypothetical protein